MGIGISPPDKHKLLGFQHGELLCFSKTEKESSCQAVWSGS